ncbi:MAG TPA: hypothetical protein VM513_31645, partial [Kofleriaceae bacterium]|nr:hypothetical protein [Kofleriaceae bacterium]
MDEPKTAPVTETKVPVDVPSEQVVEPMFPRGSGQIERTENSVMEGLPAAKAERIAAMRRDLAELQRQLIEAQQRIATELQGRAEDAERFEALELKAQHDATRAAELEIQILGLRDQLASTEEQRTVLATRDTQIDGLRQELTARDAQLEELRKQHAEQTEQLELQFASLRDTKALVEARDAELEKVKAARDKLEAEHEKLVAENGKLVAENGKLDAERGDLEQARRDLDAMRAKASEVASQLVRLGQDLIDGNGAVTASADVKPAAAPPRVERPAPPPLPPQRAPSQPVEASQVETIIDLTEPKPGMSRLTAGLLAIGGVIVGCAATFAIVDRNAAVS